MGPALTRPQHCGPHAFNQVAAGGAECPLRFVTAGGNGTLRRWEMGGGGGGGGAPLCVLRQPPPPAGVELPSLTHLVFSEGGVGVTTITRLIYILVD